MTARRAKRTGPRSSRTKRAAATASSSAVSLKAIVREGLLRPPITLWSQYRGQSLSAAIQPDGSILFQGVRCASPSIAAAKATKPLHEEGDRPKATDGWTFWQVQDPASNEMVPLDILRERYRQRKRTKAERAGGGGA